MAATQVPANPIIGWYVARSGSFYCRDCANDSPVITDAGVVLFDDGEHQHHTGLQRCHVCKEPLFIVYRRAERTQAEYALRQAAQRKRNQWRVAGIISDTLRDTYATSRYESTVTMTVDGVDYVVTVAQQD